MATISIFDIFKIGIGPSSSHTTGPMKAAREFVTQLESVAAEATSIQVTLYGSLAFTGKGHGTDSAIMLGLMGLQPETIDPGAVEGILRGIHASHELDVMGMGCIEFDPEKHIFFDVGEELPRHTNGMRFVASIASGESIIEELYYSLGGGFIARGDEPSALDALDWVNAYAIAVNEESAVGGRVVTSPTNGAAEIGMEHNLGLTCDPIGGLVQIPCIERNAMGSVKAINAARLAMHGDGTHKVSPDQVIETMRQTGLAMSSSFKETSKGGLAVNVPEC